MVLGLLIILAFIIGVIVGYVYKGDIKISKTVHHINEQKIVVDDKDKKEEKSALGASSNIYDIVDEFIAKGDFTLDDRNN